MFIDGFSTKFPSNPQLFENLLHNYSSFPSKSGRVLKIAGLLTYAIL